MFKFGISKGMTGISDVNEFAKLIRWMPDGCSDGCKIPPAFGAYIWQFYREFWQCRQLENVHVVTYEGMRRDLGGLLPGIAGLLGVTLTDELKAKVLELSSFQWMKDNEHQFDDHYMGPRHKQVADEHAAAGREIEYVNTPEARGMTDRKFTTSSKVGLQVGDGFNTTISDDTRQLLAELWLQEVTPVTGHQTYAEMESDFAKTI